MNYQAGEVATKMLRRFDTNSRTITPFRAAQASFRDLGIEKRTNGSFRHELVMGIMNSIPIGIASKFMFKMSKVVFEKR